MESMMGPLHGEPGTAASSTAAGGSRSSRAVVPRSTEFLPATRAEFLGAAESNEQPQAGLGTASIDAVEAVVMRAAETRLCGAPTDHTLRCGLLACFACFTLYVPDHAPMENVGVACSRGCEARSVPRRFAVHGSDTHSFSLAARSPSVDASGFGASVPYSEKLTVRKTSGLLFACVKPAKFGSMLLASASIISGCGGADTNRPPDPPPVPGSLFFEMDYSAATAPIGGWNGIRPDNADHTMTRVAGIGPTGQDGYRLVMDHTGPMGGDNYWGHGRVFTGAPFAYGDRVYFRWRFRWRPGTDCRAYEQGGTGLLSAIYRNKILIVNDASSSATSRFIMQVECNRNPLNYYWRLQKGGGVDPAQTPTYAVSTNWVDVQVELQYSSAAGVADGAYRIWIDNNSRAAPSAQVTGILLHADVSPGYVQFGAYFNNGVYPGGIIAWEHTNFQIGDDFDIGWDNP